MTLRPCYRATCDAPGCVSAEMLPHERSGPARAELEALGWRAIPHREAPTSGAPRILYACPQHRGWSPTDGLPPCVSMQERRWLQARRAGTFWMLHGAGASYAAIADAIGLSRARVAGIGELYERVTAGREHDAADWQEPWARRLRAAGAIP